MIQGRNTYYITSSKGNAHCNFFLTSYYFVFLSSLFRLLSHSNKITFIDVVLHLFNTLFVYIRAYYALLCTYVVILLLKVIKCWLESVIIASSWHDKIGLGLSTLNISLYKQLIHFKV